MRAYVRFGLPDGTSVELGHGAILGRLWSADLPLSDGRISEAHAMVSLRGRELKLLALRGRFAVDGTPRSSLVLEPGRRIVLAEGLALEVEEVHLPPRVFAVEGDDLARVVVDGVCRFKLRPRPELLPRYLPDAPAHLWSDGDGWCLSIGGAQRLVQPGDSWQIEGRTFRAVSLALDTASRSATRLDGRVAPPLRVVARHDTAHLHVEGGESLALSGLAARLLSEVVAFDGPVPWRVLAGELWPWATGEFRWWPPVGGSSAWRGPASKWGPASSTSPSTESSSPWARSAGTCSSARSPTGSSWPSWRGTPTG